MTTLIPKFDLKDGNSTPTGAVNRPINEKLAEVVSVKDFGATGDGTTDDTIALQAAFDANMPLYFPLGIYKITTGLTFNPYLTYVGENYSLGGGTSPVTIKAATVGITMLKPKTQYGYQTQFTNIFLDGDNKAAIGFQWLCTAGGDQADLTMTNVGAFNCTSKGYDLQLISYSQFTNVHTRNCPIGFYMKSCVSSQLSNCEFYCITTAGLYLDSCAFLRIYNCYAFNSGAINHLVLVDGGHGNKFEKCQFEPAPSPTTQTNNAVTVTNSYYATDNCTDNTFLNCEWIGISGSCICNLNIGEGLSNPNQIYKTKVINCSFIKPVSTSSIELAAQRYTQIFNSIDTRIYNDADYFNVSVSNDSPNIYYQEGFPGTFYNPVTAKTLGVQEGNVQPASITGYSLIYLDVADNKLKIVSSAGVVRTITTT